MGAKNSKCSCMNPYEIQVYYVLPAIRRDLSKYLKQLGLNQKQIAELFHVRESTISQYGHSHRASEVKFTVKISEELKLAAKRIKDNGNALKEIMAISQSKDVKQLICKMCDIGEKTCDICLNQNNYVISK